MREKKHTLFCKHPLQQTSTSAQGFLFISSLNRGRKFVQREFSPRTRASFSSLMSIGEVFQVQDMKYKLVLWENMTTSLDFQKHSRCENAFSEKYENHFPPDHRSQRGSQTREETTGNYNCHHLRFVLKCPSKYNPLQGNVFVWYNCESRDGARLTDRQGYG